jgi:hypothetical protein
MPADSPKSIRPLRRDIRDPPAEGRLQPLRLQRY